jgi:hypothetical protein
LFFAKDGTATINPTIIEIIIETTEMKIVVVNPLNRNLRLVKPSTLFGDKINQLSSFLPHDANGNNRSKKRIFFTY